MKSMQNSAATRVLRHDSALTQRLTNAELWEASRRSLAPVIALRKGIFWPHERFPQAADSLGLLVLDGMLLRGLAVTDRPTLEVLGPGDLFRPFDVDPNVTVTGEARWWALRPATVAVLDASFTRRMCSYPAVIEELLGRICRRSAASSVRLALATEPRLSVRLHRTLWQLADRFGEPEGDGIALCVPLCHALLSWLVGARRPAVSRAINELERAGLMTQRRDGTWWLGRRAELRVGLFEHGGEPVAA